MMQKQAVMKREVSESQKYFLEMKNMNWDMD